MKISEIAFVGYPVTDMKRARAFYEGVLGLKNGVEMMPDQWIEYDTGAGTIALAAMGDQWKPSSDGPALAFEVDDFEKAVEEIKAAGVEITMGPYESPVCWMILVRDPDGNTLCIHRRHNHAS